jgi:parallel beta-helix repeat protein
LKLIGEDNNTTIINGSGSGYCVHITADNVEIGGLTIKNGFYGVYLESSNGSIIDNNIISYHCEGISLSDSNSNLIAHNSLHNNGGYISGIHLSSSHNNVIRDNDLAENVGSVSLRDSDNNLIYHNNFVDNIAQASDKTGTNSWDNGPVEGGNYWSDHSCIGNPSDKPYSIGSDGVDHYPFQDQNGWLKGVPDGNTITNTIGMEFVLIPTGEFEMGSPSDERSVHHVNIKNAFYMGRYEVTQKQWRAKPTLITFIYGPINSGKTELINQIVPQLPADCSFLSD